MGYNFKCTAAPWKNPARTGLFCWIKRTVASTKALTRVSALPRVEKLMTRGLKSQRAAWRRGWEEKEAAVGGMFSLFAVAATDDDEVFVVQAEMRITSKPTTKSEAMKRTFPQAGCSHRLGSKR